MNITIKNYLASEIDRLITPDTDLYCTSVVVAVPSSLPSKSLVDISFRVKMFAVSESDISIIFPNGALNFFQIPSSLYSSIEVI